MNVYDLEGLELTHLRYFVVLAEELHFGRAAEKLNISQPPLTQQIQRLEARVGHALLRRTSRRTELTAAGQRFYETARLVLADARHGLDATRRLARGESGVLTVATPPSLMLDTLPSAILEFRQQAPGVDLRLREMATSRIVDALQSGIADVGFMRGHIDPSGMETLVRWKEDVVAILPLKHALARDRRFRLKSLAAEPFVFFPRDLGPEFYEELVGYCREAGFEPRVTQEASQWSSVVSLVSAGIGVSLGPASVANLLTGTVAIRPLPRVSTTVHLIAASERENPAAARFAAIVEKRRRSS